MSETATSQGLSKRQPEVIVTIERDLDGVWALGDVNVESHDATSPKPWRPKTDRNAGDGALAFSAFLAILTMKDHNRDGKKIHAETLGESKLFEKAKKQWKGQNPDHWSRKDGCPLGQFFGAVAGVAAKASKMKWDRNKSHEAANLRFNIVDVLREIHSVEGFLRNYLAQLAVEEIEGDVPAPKHALQQLPKNTLSERLSHEITSEPHGGERAANEQYGPMPGESEQQYFRRFWRPTFGVSELFLTGRRVGNYWLRLLATEPERFGLWHLYLAHTKITNAGMTYLKALENLKTLALDYTNIDDEGAQHLTSLKKLECLYLAGTDVGDKGAKFLQGLHSLRELSLSHTRLQPKDLDSLIGRTKLHSLWLDRVDEVSHSGISKDDLEPLVGLKPLKLLAITGSKIGDKGLQKLLRRHTTFEELYLEDTGISDEGVESLLKLANTLHSLSLNNNVLIRDSIPKLKTCTSLGRLQLSGTRVVFKSICELFELPLTELYLQNTSINEEEADEIRRGSKKVGNRQIKIKM